MKQLTSLDLPVSQFVSQLQIFDRILNVPSPSEVCEYYSYINPHLGMDLHIHVQFLPINETL